MGKDPSAAMTLGERIADLRAQRRMSLLDLMTAVRLRLPRPLWVTDETLRRYERDKVSEDRADPILIAAIAAALGCDVRDLSEPIAAQLADVRELLRAMGVDGPPFRRRRRPVDRRLAAAV